MKRNRLLLAQHSIVLEMFENGLAQTRIADSLNVPVSAVKKVIRNKYPDFSGRRLLPSKEVVTKYKLGMTMEELSLEYNTTIATIKSRLLDAEVEILSSGEQNRKHFFDDDFFSVIDTEKKAYWLGFLFADGTVMSTRKDIVLSLNSRDHEHLEKFMSDISYIGPGIVKRYTGESFAGQVKYSRVSLRSEKMWADLVSHGCIPNKSKDIGPPLDMPKKFNKDFIRGVLDGGGYVSAKGFPSVEIVGSHSLLEWIAQELEMSEPRPHKTIWRIRSSGAKAQKIASYLYIDATVALLRKQERAHTICEAKV